MKRWFSPAIPLACTLMSTVFLGVALAAPARPLVANGTIARLHGARPGGGCSFLLEGRFEETLGYVKIVVAVPGGLAVRRVGRPERLRIHDLEFGQRVRVTFRRAYETFPVQVEATSVTILSATPTVDKVSIRGVVEIKEPENVPNFFIVKGDPAQMHGYERLGIMVEDFTQYHAYPGFSGTPSYESIEEEVVLQVVLRGGIIEGGKDFPPQARAAAVWFYPAP